MRRLIVGSNKSVQWLLIGGALAYLPWLHYRLAPIAITLGAMALIRYAHVNDLKDWTALVILPVASSTLLFAWYGHLYGSPLPPSSDHAGFSGLFGTINGMAGTFFDQQWGAVVHNPLLMLAMIAVPAFAIEHGKEAAILAAMVIPYLLLIDAYRVWWGEWNPPGRYLTDVVPLAAAPLAWWISTLPRRWRSEYLVAAGVPAGAVMVTFVHNPQLMYNQPDGTSKLMETWSSWFGIKLTDLVPSFVFYSESSALDRMWFAGAISAVIVLLAVAAYIDGLKPNGAIRTQVDITPLTTSEER